MGLHPALRQLIAVQMQARFRRAANRFRQPRRLVLSCLAIALACLWLGQAILGILFRSSAPPEKLLLWIPLGLAGYAGWHILRCCIRAPIEPFEWTPTEKEMLGGAPLARFELVRYRLACILLPAVMKSGCFALVMIPDLGVFWAGWLGMLLALVSLDLLRMLMEILTYGMTRRTFLWWRTACMLLAAAVALSAMVPVMLSPEVLASPDSLSILRGMVDELATMSASTLGAVLIAPFALFAKIMITPAIDAQLCGAVGLSVGLVSVLMIAVVALDRRLWQVRIDRERRAFAGSAAETRAPAASRTPSARRWRQPIRGLGAACIAWRQAWGARTYEASILVALLVPGVLSLLPMLGSSNARVAAVQMVGSLIFYSLVLLPAAFKFDFRRDLDRLVVLKTLPISPWAVAAGQLAVPVLLCSCFQLGVMLIGMAVRPFGVTLLLSALATMALANLLIFALENLVFLLYPYRLNQEGVDIFLRSIIVLTAKTVLFGLGLAVTLCWTYVGRHLELSNGLAAQQVFLGGMVITLAISALFIFALLVRTYRRFDPSQDVPAMS